MSYKYTDYTVVPKKVVTRTGAQIVEQVRLWAGKNLQHADARWAADATDSDILREWLAVHEHEEVQP